MTWLVILVGVMAGACGGFLGTGGSIVMIPMMTEFLGPNQHLYQATAMMMNFSVVVPAVMHHCRVGAVHWGLVKRCAPIAALGVIAGVSLSEQGFFSGRGEANLRMLFGLFLVGNAGVELWQAIIRAETYNESYFSINDAKNMAISWRLAAGIALPMGLIAGFLGVGGGVVAVPLQRRLLGIGIRSAIANSAALIVTTSLLGATYKNYAYQQFHGDWTQPVRLAILLIPGAIMGSMVGSRLTHRLPKKWVKVAFIVLLLAAGARMMFRAWHDLS